MTVHATTRRFRPPKGTDWVPSVEEITTIILDVGMVDDAGSASDTNSEHVEKTLEAIHIDGTVGISIQLETAVDNTRLSIGATAATASGGSLNIAADTLQSIADIWGTTVPHPPWVRSSSSPAYPIGDTVRFRRSPGLGIDWSEYRWTWHTLVRAMDQQKEGTQIRFSFLSTTDGDTMRSDMTTPCRPLPRLWATDLTLTIPQELSNINADRIAKTLFGLPSSKVVEWIDTRSDLDATAYGIPIVGGTRRRFPGTAIRTSKVASLLGFTPVQLRLEEDIW